MAIAVALLALTAYGVTLSPSITFQHDAADSAELAAAAYTFGVPHPTGYPLWLLMAAPLARLPLPGDVAYRLGWLSALCAAFAGALLTWITVQLLAFQPAAPAFGPRRGGLSSRPPLGVLAGAVAGLALVTSPGVWNIAVVTETYALHLLLIVALIGAALFALPTASRAFLGGLALANHVTALPVVIVALLPASRGDRYRFWHLLWLLPGFALYAILPWRAHMHPASNWGDPETPAALASLVSGSAYRYLVVVPSFGDGVVRILATLHALIGQYSLVCWLPAIVGLPALACDPRLRRWLAVGALYPLLPIFYRAAGVEHYLLPDLVLLALGAGFGAARCAGLLARTRHQGRPLAWLLLVGLTGPALWLGAQSSSLRRDDGARQWARLALSRAAPNQVIVTSEDWQTFGLWYMQRVEGMRPDVTVLDQRLWPQPWYRQQLAGAP